MLTIYGIKNCNTVQKVITYLNEHEIAFTFHDFKKEGITKPVLKDWMKQIDWQILLNKKGTTYRKLTDEQKAAIVDEASAIEVLMEHTSMIKRPVIVQDKKLLGVGYDLEILQTLS